MAGLDAPTPLRALAGSDDPTLRTIRPCNPTLPLTSRNTPSRVGRVRFSRKVCAYTCARVREMFYERPPLPTLRAVR